MTSISTRPANQYVRDVLRTHDPPPPIPVRFFYTSPYVIDDPLSPLPAPQQQAQQHQPQQPSAYRSGNTKASTAEASTAVQAQQQHAQHYQHPPRPFSVFDNDALEAAWLALRKKMLKSLERYSTRDNTDISKGEKSGELRRSISEEAVESEMGVGKPIRIPAPRQSSSGSIADTYSSGVSSGSYGKKTNSGGSKSGNVSTAHHTSSTSPSHHSWYEPPGRAYIGAASDGTGSLTGTPFIRAPSRKQQLGQSSLSRGLDAGGKEAKLGVKDGIKDGKAQSRSRTRPRPSSQTFSSFNEENGLAPPGSAGRNVAGVVGDMTRNGDDDVDDGLVEEVPVGVSRLHQVVMPQLQMEPIYWSPLNDIATVVRATWFYKDNMLPVEVEVANMLEAGYVALRPWTMTWKDELDSAIAVGAEGEMKVLHKLWPDKRKDVSGSRPETARYSGGTSGIHSMTSHEQLDPEKEREHLIEEASVLVDVSTGQTGNDNKASGIATYGRDGYRRLYRTCGVIYANENEAYILKSSLQPSAYYGRRPLANYIRRGRAIGIKIVRGFDEDAWLQLHPPTKKKLAKVAASTKKSTAAKALEGVSASQAGPARLPPKQRQKVDSTLAASQRPVVTDLVLVIHGIGQKLSERMESYHFTHAMNGFRREVNVALGTEHVKAKLRFGMGGIMVLPINWRLSLSFEEGGYRDSNTPFDPTANRFSLKDITPTTLPSVRNIISDVMLDVPYYLSQEYNPKMTAACIKEANRIYRLWCLNNPGFEEYGRVHLIAHSLGSVMAVDILSQQPTYVQPFTQKKKDHADLDSKSAENVDATLEENKTSSLHETKKQHNAKNDPDELIPTDHFLFNTTCLFTCGSPAGFFLLLKKAALLPRRDRRKADFEACIDLDDIYTTTNITNVTNNIVNLSSSTSLTASASASASLNDVLAGVAGDAGTYGCLAVDNVYNIINPYDPIAYHMNAAIDAAYAAALRPAFVPTGRTGGVLRMAAGWLGFGAGIGSADGYHGGEEETQVAGSAIASGTGRLRGVGSSTMSIADTRGQRVNGYNAKAMRSGTASRSTTSESVDTIRPVGTTTSTSTVATTSYPYPDPSSPTTLPNTHHTHNQQQQQTLELETHDFTREQIAERRAHLLNDNGQVDYLLRYGGGPLEIQYLTMLGAHSSYWLAREFASMVVVEVGRVPGRRGTVAGLRARKKGWVSP